MKKRFVAAFVVFVFAMGTLAWAAAGQPVLTWESGTLFFYDAGIEPERRTLVLHGYEGHPEVAQLVDRRILKPHEYTLINTPEGIIGYDIQFDDAFDASQYDFMQISLEGNETDRVATANGFQFVPDTLYLYIVKTDGALERSIQRVGSYVVNPFQTRHTHYMYMQTVSVQYHDGLEQGLDDSDTFYFAGGDYIHLSFDRWMPENSGWAHMYYAARDVSDLALGSSMNLPIFGLPDRVRNVTVTITKETVLRCGPLAESLTASVQKGDDISVIAGQSESGWYASEMWWAK